MTKIKVGLIGVLVVAGVAVPWSIQLRTQAQLRETGERLRQQTEQNRQLALDNEQLTRRAANSTAAVQTPNNPPADLLKLRGEVGRLRRENAEANAPITQEMVQSRYNHAQEL